VDSLDWVERDEDGKEQVWQLRDDGIGPEEMACREELARIVREEVGRLSEAMQEVVRLRLAEVPLDNVGKSRMFRAKRVLREKLLERGVVVLKGGREDGRQAGSPL
jgi:DNA-directed RNA polymerase specialized sigma24 family protein